MKHVFLAVFLTLFAGMASAQVHDYPALYNVTGVAAHDVLNVRSGPGTSHNIIGSLAPNATGVEVIGVNEERRWARVSMGEFSGWAHTRFLTRTGPDWNSGLPAPLYCYGTEPFWGYERLIGGGTWSDIETPGDPYAELWSGPAAARGPTAFGMTLDSGASTIAAFIRRGICSDGMRDRDFGLLAQFIRVTPEGNAMYDGCGAVAR